MGLMGSSRRATAMVVAMMAAVSPTMASAPEQSAAARSVQAGEFTGAVTGSRLRSHLADNSAWPHAPLTSAASAPLPTPVSLPFAGRPHGALQGGAAAGVTSGPASATNLASSVTIEWRRPLVEAMVEDSRRQGAPVVHVWQNTLGLVNIGMNRHGLPGIYLVRKLP